MATISKGITLSYGDKALTNLLEIPDLDIGGDVERIEITTLADATRKYTDGLKNVPESIEFKFIYEETQFTTLNALADVQQWKVSIPDGGECSFSGTCGVRLDGVGIGAALTYTLTVRPTTELVWA
jgi:hypothetical protein